MNGEPPRTKEWSWLQHRLLLQFDFDLTSKTKYFNMFLFFYFKLYSFLLHFSFVLVSKFVQKNATNAQLFVKGVDHCTHFLSLSLNSGWARSLKRQTILSELLMNIDILTPTPRHTHSLIAAIVLLLQLFAQIFPEKEIFFLKNYIWFQNYSRWPQALQTVNPISFLPSLWIRT